MSTDKRVVIISGGSRGLGQALVQDRLDAGDIVATFSRSSSGFIDEMRSADPQGERFHWEPIEGTDLDGVRTFGMNVMRRYKRIDALINNAGVGLEGLLTMTSERDIHLALTLNLESVIVLTRTCLKAMIAARHGSIINISSVNALRGHKGLTVYSATKAALLGFTRSLASEVGPQGVTVNAIAPGFFESDMVGHLTDAQRARIIRRTPMRAMCTTQDIVDSARFLLSTRAITGQTLSVDGGFSC
ncbi:SDR family NAD(P)-dependent oxidoreductase [Lysobacter silvisoli]|uniref:SDR family NAD(P)-dependent oxidoreductase n=1 Tax=Lysobacter silvisoli TaxID=2293254 RepID=UPI0018C89A80|nr:SDR family NAD(P)-dependent oxidoreductase [Lysobacter silvisoli]